MCTCGPHLANVCRNCWNKMCVQEVPKQNVCAGSAETKCVCRKCWNKMCVQEVLKQSVCAGSAETKCVCRKCWNKVCVQEVLKQSVCAGSAETKCVWRKCWNKMCVQEVLKQSVCAGSAETKCLSITAGAFNRITIHDNFKNRTEIKHKHTTTTISNKSTSTIHDCYFAPFALLTEEHQSWNLKKKSCPNFQIMYQPTYIWLHNSCERKSSEVHPTLTQTRLVQQGCTPMLCTAP